MNAPEGNLSSKTAVSSSGALILLTMWNWPLRALATPLGGKTILLQVAATSFAVSGWPSQNLTSFRILNAYFLPPSVGLGISAHTSHTKSVGGAGVCGGPPGSQNGR